MKAAARAAVAAGLTGYILWKSHPRAVLAALAGADWRLIAIAVLLVLVDRALMAYRWVVLLCIIDPAERPPFIEVMRIFFVSTFVGTFLPASIGGDAVRAYSMAQLKVRGSDAVARTRAEGSISATRKALKLSSASLTRVHGLLGS